MRTYKRELKDGVRKAFIVKIGRKIRILNSKYYGKKTK